VPASTGCEKTIESVFVEIGPVFGEKLTTSNADELPVPGLELPDCAPVAAVALELEDDLVLGPPPPPQPVAREPIASAIAIAVTLV
jgi:hypothetical protein